MNKNKIIIIACLMGLALIGLVVLQIRWISHDLALRQEKFTQQATEAVQRAIEKIETGVSVQLISEEMSGILDDSLTGYFKSFPVVVPEAPDPPEAPDLPPGPEILMELDSIDLPHSFTFIADGDTIMGENEVQVFSKNDNNREEVTIAINASKDQAAAMSSMREDLKEANRLLEIERKNLNPQRKLAIQHSQLRREKEKVNLRVKRLSNVIEKMAVEYERRDANLLERVEPPIVDSLVRSELRNNGIYLPYSIELTSGGNDSILWKRRDPQQSEAGNKVVSVRLFPGDIVNRNDAVKITFSDTIRHFITSMWLMLLSSILFTGIVIFAFTYTIIVIFRQKKLSEIKNDFINNMTHEFKTPIATIKLASEAIGNPEVINDSEKIKYYTRIIKDENERMNNHVESILQMAQFDKQAFAPNMEEIDMREIINETILMMQLHAENKGGKIIFTDNAQKYLVNADKRFIPLVILNLLDNAIKYSERNPEIEINTNNDSSTLIIKVSDNGIGMSMDKQKKIFEKFYRVPTGNLHNVKGFGLGLSYVKAIVTAHGGSISVKSTPGEGSSFEVRLPLV